MREVFKMWKYTKMVVLTALCAGIYAAVLIPFKGFVLIPGITEFRPASALPVVLGLLFGPAGAWGAAIGNLIGDFFGSIGIGSIFGFVGNFMFAYIPYKLWDNLGIVKKDDFEPNLKSSRKVGVYILGALMGSLGCALVIAWGLELLKMVPFGALGTIISLNNSIPSVILGIPILIVLYPRIKKWDLYWKDIMREEDFPKAGRLPKIGSIIMVCAVTFGIVAGVGIALGVGQALFQAGFASGVVGNASVIAVAGLGVLGLAVSCALQ